MYIAYLDDAGSTGRNLADQKSPFQVVGAILLRDDYFGVIEILLGQIIDEAVPEDQRVSFEFHASDLWHGNAPFEDMPREKRIDALRNCLAVVSQFEIPVIYGAVDKKRLSEQIYSTADPIDIAFRLCVEGVENWMKSNLTDDLAVLIADESDKGKHAMKNAFRQYRRKIRSVIHNRGKLEHLLDDMFFGSSSDSLGIQMVDVCNFAIERHLRGDLETEYLYNIIRERIHWGKVYPDQGV